MSAKCPSCAAIFPADLGTLACSFCGKSRAEVGMLVQGPAISICEDCIQLCVSIIAEELRERVNCRPPAKPEEKR